MTPFVNFVLIAQLFVIKTIQLFILKVFQNQNLVNVHNKFVKLMLLIREKNKQLKN